MTAEPAATEPKFLRNALILGLLTAIGPFAIDMYLPSLPSVGASLGAGTDAAVMSMTAFMIAFSAGQLIYGPVSDMVGRKPPLYFGTVLFVLAGIGCALSTSIGMLVAFRAVQGFGGSASVVIARAIVRDLHRGVDEAKLLSLLMLVFSVSPLLAPFVGSQIVAVASWRAVFWVVTALAALGLLMIAFAIEETRPAAARGASSLRGMLIGCGVLFRDRRFMGLTLIGGFAFAGFFVFLGNSSFVLQGHYRLSPTQYALCFSACAAAFFVTSQFNGLLGKRFGLEPLVRPAVYGYAAALAVMFAVAMAGVDDIAAVGAPFLVSDACLGLVIPVTSVLALDDHGPIAGTASSLMGTLQLTMGSVVMAISSGFADGSLAPMVAAIAACGLGALTLTFLTLGRAKPAAVRSPSPPR